MSFTLPLQPMRVVVKFYALYNWWTRFSWFGYPGSSNSAGDLFVERTRVHWFALTGSVIPGMWVLVYPQTEAIEARIQENYLLKGQEFMAFEVFY